MGQEEVTHHQLTTSYAYLKAVQVVIYSQTEPLIIKERTIILMFTIKLEK